MKIKEIKSFAVALLLLVSASTVAQTITTRYEATGAYGSGDYAPFWHTANRQGLGSHKTGSFYTRLGVEGNHSFNSKTWVET